MTVVHSTSLRCAFHQSAARAARLGFDEVTVISGGGSFSGGGRRDAAAGRGRADHRGELRMPRR